MVKVICIINGFQEWSIGIAIGRIAGIVGGKMLQILIVILIHESAGAAGNSKCCSQQTSAKAFFSSILNSFMSFSEKLFF